LGDEEMSLIKLATDLYHHLREGEAIENEVRPHYNSIKGKYLSHGMIGGLAGAGIGAGIGHLMKKENALFGGAIGGILGLGLGLGVAEDRRNYEAESRAIENNPSLKKRLHEFTGVENYLKRNSTPTPIIVPIRNI
jgi:hypothetical protein